MKIVGNNLQNILKTYLGTNQDSKIKNQEEKNSIPVDQVNVSSQASELLMARKAFDALPDIREDRVNEIQSKLTNNSYQVDDSKIGESILSNCPKDDSI